MFEEFLNTNTSLRSLALKHKLSINGLKKILKKKDRFNIFKRDGFTCVYCGRRPPEIMLELDHVIPISRGGPDVPDNMMTSCRECNRGKGASPLTELPPTLERKTFEIEEREKQYREYQKALRRRQARERKEICSVQDVFAAYFEGKAFTTRFHSSVRKFLELLGLEEVKACMEVACSRIQNDPERALQYFCGICWKDRS